MTDEEKIRLKQKMESKLEELQLAIKDLKEASKPQGLDNAEGRLSRMD